jgi:hypothetical protein
VATLKEILELLVAHPALIIAILITSAVLVFAYYCFSAWVGTLEMPGPDATIEERRRFVFLNRLAANLERAATALHVPHEPRPPD